MPHNSRYNKHGLVFNYPSDWTIEETRQGGEISVHVQSPATTFWCVTVMPDRPQPERTVKTVVEAFQDSYDDVDVYDLEYGDDDEMHLIQQIDFVCHELVNTAIVESLQIGLVTLVILYQGLDQELNEYNDELKYMSDSIEVEFGDDVVIT